MSEPTRILFWSALLGLAFVTILAVKSFAYDATGSFTQDYPELVKSWDIRYGATKGGPYATKVNCGKPAPVDGRYVCSIPNITLNPIYAVAVAIGHDGVESGPSNEVEFKVTVPPPADFKVVVTVRTVATLNKYGNPVMSTTVSRKEVAVDTPVKEWTSTYWNSAKRERVTNTVIAMN